MYDGPESSLCTCSIYSVHFLHITASYSNNIAHFSNIAVSAHFSEVGVQLSEVNTSLISISARFSLIAGSF